MIIHSKNQTLMSRPVRDIFAEEVDTLVPFRRVGIKKIPNSDGLLSAEIVNKPPEANVAEIEPDTTVTEKFSHD